jgi:hypothetical protein
MARTSTKPAPRQCETALVSSDIDSVVAEHANAIRALARNVIANVVEIGRRLTEVNDRIEHGHWLMFLDREFGWSDQTARNFMHVFDLSNSKRVLDLDLPLRSLYLLAAPSTPSEVRDKVIEDAQRGERPTHTEVVTRVRQSRSSSGKSRNAEATQSEQEPAEAPEPAVDRRAEGTLDLSEDQPKSNGAAGAPAVKVPELAEPPLLEAEPEPDARPIAPAAADTPADTETPSRHRHRGSGNSASSAVAIAKRQLTELAAHGLKAEPQKVVSALRKEFPQGDLIENLTRWLDHFLAEMRKAATESTTSATENAQKPAAPSEPSLNSEMPATKPRASSSPKCLVKARVQ